MRRYILCMLAGIAIFFSSCAMFDPPSIQKELAAEYFTIAEGYADISRYDKAIEFYNKSLAQKEYVNASKYGLGRMYSLSGKWKEACDYFSELYTQEPENDLVSTAYAYALVSNGQTSEALEIYEAVWKRNDEDPVVIRNYAEILHLSGRYSETLSLIDALKEKYPDSEAMKGIEVLEKKAQDGLAPPEPETETEDDAVETDDQTNQGDQSEIEDDKGTSTTTI